MTPARRALTFASLDEVMPYVDRLLEGYTTVGNWSLAQICEHLARSINCTIDGFPVRAPWIVRKTLGRLLLWRILRTGRFAEGMKAPAEYQPAGGGDERAAAEGLRAALRRFATHAGPLVEHPMGGWVSREVWVRFHCIHCAHHLSFAVPAEREGGGSAGSRRVDIGEP
jgi:hypothetical protein